MPTNKKDLSAFLVPSGTLQLAPTPQLRASSNRHLQQRVTVPTVQKSSDQVIVTLPKYGNLAIASTASMGSTTNNNNNNRSATAIAHNAEQFPRGFAEPHSNPIDVGGFRCTSRGSARLIALPEQQRPPVVTSGRRAVVGASTASTQNESNLTPDVSIIEQNANGGGVKLRDIWKFGLRTKAPLLTEVDPDTIGRPYEKTTATNDASLNNNNTRQKQDASSASSVLNNAAVDITTTQQQQKVVKMVRIQPEFLHRGMVQPPQAEVVEVDLKVLEDDAARLMNPAQRRALMESQRKAREGLVALREVQAAKTKLSRTCQKLYPHGALGCEDGPYSSNPDESAYKQLSASLAAEATKVGRKGKKDAIFSRPHDTGDVILNRDLNRHTNFFLEASGVTNESSQQTGGESVAELLKKDYVGIDPTRKGGLRTSGTCKPKDQLRMFAVGV